MIAEIYAAFMILASSTTGCLSIYYANKTNRSNNLQDQYYPDEY